MDLFNPFICLPLGKVKCWALITRATIIAMQVAYGQTLKLNWNSIVHYYIIIPEIALK
jgi:hypothetical protein